MESGIKFPNRLLTTAEVAEILNIQERTVRDYVNQKKLTPCKNVGGLRFTPAEIQEFIGADAETFSPFIVRKLEKALTEKDREILELKKEILYKNGIIEKIGVVISGA